MAGFYCVGKLIYVTMNERNVNFDKGRWNFMETINTVSSILVASVSNFSQKHSVRRLHRNVLDFSGFLYYLLVLVGIKLPLCEVVTSSYNNISCFLESS